MATGWKNYSSTSGGQNSNFTTTAWDMMKLGKRHELTETPTTVAKRNKPSWPASVGVTCLSSPVVARCQVEGCHVALCNAKDYYRKHKVCEIHSKAPKVTVLGLQQRFCQQCSRFHGVTEFDEAKRSCRRRLKGHNQRRRKGSFSNPHSMRDERRLEPLKPGCALSFLSSPISEPWNCSGHEFSSRCSYEIMGGNNGGSYSYVCHQTVSDNENRNDREEIKQQISPGLEFGVLSKSNDGEEWTDYCWSTFGGANVV